MYQQILGAIANHAHICLLPWKVDAAQNFREDQVIQRLTHMHNKGTCISHCLARGLCPGDCLLPVSSHYGDIQKSINK